MEIPTSFSAIKDGLADGSLTVPSLVDGYLNRIAAGDDLNAFLEVFGEEAKSRAVEVQARIENKTAGRLAGMVIALKDNIVYKGHASGAASKILDGFTSLFSATVVERLLAEDAIIIGRVNCDEFAMGSSNENSSKGAVKNPLDKMRVPGGSSGGSAAAVAANMCLVALGSDTGGSVRQPASFCGIVGLKPTYGRVSRHGLIAYASSLDQIGPLGHNVADVALVTEVMAGPDGYDATASQKAVGSFTSLDKKETYRLAYPEEFLTHEGISTEVKTQFKDRLNALKEAGHTISSFSFPYLEQLVPCYNVISNAEASSNLSRFDGIRFGYRSENAEGIEGTFSKSRSEGFGEEVKRRIMLGTFVLSSGYYDAYYSKAQKVRRLIADHTNEVLASADAIITPTTPHGAFELNAKADPISLYLEDIFTVQANLAGVPGISIPQFTDPNGMPVGLQIMTGKFEEAELFSIAETLAV